MEGVHRASLSPCVSRVGSQYGPMIEPRYLWGLLVVPRDTLRLCPNLTTWGATFLPHHRVVMRCSDGLSVIG